MKDLETKLSSLLLYYYTNYCYTFNTFINIRVELDALVKLSRNCHLT